MTYNSKKTKTTTWILIAIVFNCFLSCDSRQDSKKSKLANILPVDSFQIKELLGNYREGKETFQSKCSTCHIAPDRNVVDQYVFDNLFDRLPKPSEDCFEKFIKNSKVLKSSGDIYAVKLAQEYNSIYDHVFQDSLSNMDIDDLIVYIKVAAKQRYRR